MSTETRGAGRPREFEPDDAINAAMGVFWGRTFGDVSVGDLEVATGVVRTSLYNAFGNKRAIFDLALDHYLAVLAAEVNRQLIDASGGLSDITEFLTGLEASLRATESGCFMANAMVDFGDTDAAIVERGQNYIEMLSRGFHAPLSRAAAAGELLGSLDVATIADQLALQTLGLNLAARVGAGPDGPLGPLFAAARAGVESLRLT